MLNKAGRTGASGRRRPAASDNCTGHASPFVLRMAVPLGARREKRGGSDGTRTRNIQIDSLAL
ncbi:MAG: hypothetical protein WCP86_09440, partial [bacterium]